MNSKADSLNLPRKPNSDLGHLPGESGWPIIGATYEFLTDTFGMSDRLYRKYGPIFRSRVLFQDSVVVLGPEGSAQVLNDSEQLFSSKMAWDPILDRLFPNGLMLRDFAEHRHHRRILQSAFKKPALQGYLDAMNPQLEQGVARFAKKKHFGFKPAIKSLLLDVAAEVFLGMDIGDEAAKINQAFIDTMLGSTAVVKVPNKLTAWGRALEGRKVLEAFVEKHIPEKRANPGPDFFSQICTATDEDGNVFPDDAVRDHMIFLLFAAHDTTTSTLCSIVYLLAKHPQWQGRLHAEYAGLSAHLSYDEQSGLEDTALVLKEGLRMYPPLPSIVRRTTRDTTILGYAIPANTSVSLSPLYSHYMEDYWDKPFDFDPDRFAPERAEHKRNSHQWIPFGGGAHKCIGLNFAEIQVKLFLYHLLKNYRVSIPKGYEMKCRQVPLNFPVDDLNVTLTAR